MTKQELNTLNKKFAGQTPADIVKWALTHYAKPVVTTNFRPYEVAILHLVSREKPDIPIIWCDTGYNTPETYRHAQEVIDSLELNVQLYAPLQTVAYRQQRMGIPELDTEAHDLFTEQVKLEPFRRAMLEQQPDVWFTNLRKGQTALRDSLDVLSLSKDKVLKVSPFYYWSDTDLDQYLLQHNLPNEHEYYDPTKGLLHRECGLHK